MIHASDQRSLEHRSRSRYWRLRAACLATNSYNAVLVEYRARSERRGEQRSAAPLARTSKITFKDRYLKFITRSVQGGWVPIHTVHFAGAEERREQMLDKDGRWYYENVVYLTLYGSGGTPLASGKCWMSTARQAADWINAVLHESRVRRSQVGPQGDRIPSCSS